MTLNWQVLGSAFVMIFLAELGDKTQLSTFAFASQSKSPLSVFLGASLALVLSSLIGAGVGVALIALRSKTFGSKIPYGPFIAIAAVAWMLGGSDLWDAYIRFIMMPE